MEKYELNRFKNRLYSVLAAVCLVLPAWAQAAEIAVGQAIQHDTSAPMSNLVPLDAKAAGKNKQVPIRSRESYNRFPDLAEPDGGLQSEASSQSRFAPTPPPSLSFKGLGDDDNAATLGFRIVPPDVNGDIGLDQNGDRVYIQYINSIWAVYDAEIGSPTAGDLVAGPFAGNSFWQGFGGSCETNNDGDPVVLYDDGAGQWFFSQFSIAQGIQCVAVSTTSDPLGPYHRYAFAVTPGGQNDYPKLGVWDDGSSNSTGQSAYTFTLRDFGGAGGLFSVSAGVMERDAMLVGAPAQFVKFINPCTGADCVEGQLPPHLDGPTPPAGTCPTFWTAADAAFDDSPFANDGYRNHTLCVNWANLGSSTYNEGPLVQAGSNFDRSLGNGFSGCIAPVSGGENLDCLAIFTMFKAQYRWFGTYGSVVLNTTVEADAGRAGIRWAETRSADGESGWVLQQDGTYAPADGLERWMGSIAQDQDGNIALGYTATSGGLLPSVHYTSRMAADAAGTMPGGEVVCHAGTGAQTASSGRWGDYSSMSIDPTDDCTFWYTQEYYETTGSFDFNTRVCSFKLDGCGTTPPPGCTTDAECDDGAYCNGAETCNTGTGVCEPGAPPSMDDGVSCTVDSCNEGTNSIDHTPNDSLCDNGVFCDGTETCDPILDCQAGAGDPCPDGFSCNETDDICEPPPATTMHVDSVSTGTASAPKGRKYGTATVVVVDENGIPVGGVTVTGDFSGSYDETRSAVTNSNGVAFLQTNGTAKKNIVVDFCVSDVTGGTLAYAPDDNAAGTTCEGTEPPPPPPDATSYSLNSVSTGSRGIGGGNKVGTARVTVILDNGEPAVGYDVTGNFSGDFIENGASGTTGADGSVTIETSGSKKGKVNVSFCVSSVDGPLIYVPGPFDCP